MCTLKSLFDISQYCYSFHNRQILVITLYKKWNRQFYNQTCTIIDFTKVQNLRYWLHFILEYLKSRDNHSLQLKINHFEKLFYRFCFLYLMQLKAMPYEKNPLKMEDEFKVVLFQKYHFSSGTLFILTAS